MFRATPALALGSASAAAAHPFSTYNFDNDGAFEDVPGSGLLKADGADLGTITSIRRSTTPASGEFNSGFLNGGLTLEHNAVLYRYNVTGITSDGGNTWEQASLTPDPLNPSGSPLDGDPIIVRIYIVPFVFDAFELFFHFEGADSPAMTLSAGATLETPGLIGSGRLETNSGLGEIISEHTMPRTWTYEGLIRIPTDGYGTVDMTVSDSEALNDTRVVAELSFTNDAGAGYTLYVATYDINDDSLVDEAIAGAPEVTADQTFHWALVQDGDAFRVMFDGECIFTAPCAGWDQGSFGPWIRLTVGYNGTSVAFDQVRYTASALYPATTYDIPPEMTP